MSKQDYISIGADPEMFGYDTEGNPVPCIGLVGGTKQAPKAIGSLGAVQEDNVMAEFNIPPALSAKEFDVSIDTMIRELQSIVAPYAITLKNTPYAQFKPKQLNHPQALTIGCDPDYNAWLECKNPVVDAKKLKNIRVAAGHIHVGYPNPNQDPYSRIKLARLMDLFLGVPSVIMDPDVVRRKFYGKAGAYRPKPYGIEYRVLSNFWITNSTYRKWVYHQAFTAASAIRKWDIYAPHLGEGSDVVRIINEHDVNAAKQMCRHLGISHL
jgi:hypothetical protein